MINAITPAATPMIDTAVIIEITACRRLAVKYRRATKLSNPSPRIRLRFPQQIRDPDFALRAQQRE